MAKVGRPSMYKPEYAELAFKFCLLGADDARLGVMFDVSEQTINTWKQQYPEFLESLKNGKEAADAEIAHSLYHRAKGYSHPEVDIKMYEGQIIKTDLVKHYPPDTGAAMAWLKNRQPKQWRDKQEVDHTSTDGSMTPKPAVSVDKKLIKELAKQLNESC